METKIMAKLIGGLVHLGVENASGGITSIAAIIPDSFGDLFGIELYPRIARGEELVFGVELLRSTRGFRWEDAA